MSDSYGSWPIDALQEGNIFSLGGYFSCLEVGEEDGEGYEPSPFGSQVRVIFLETLKFSKAFLRLFELLHVLYGTVVNK